MGDDSSQEVLGTFRVDSSLRDEENLFAPTRSPTKSPTSMPTSSSPTPLPTQSPTPRLVIYLPPPSNRGKESDEGLSRGARLALGLTIVLGVNLLICVAAIRSFGMVDEKEGDKKKGDGEDGAADQKEEKSESPAPPPLSSQEKQNSKSP